ncbi:hypothetical protein F4801DRAFT_581388 [Xylaria longipes]|nr:hypothetical protein F4801DRAFT_581388 [Xylaria longipes]
MSLSRATSATLSSDDASAVPTTENEKDKAQDAVQSQSDEESNDQREVEAVLDDLLDMADNGTKSNRLIMGIDFGTTCSAVSFIALKAEEQAEHAPQIRIQSIKNYPEDMNDSAGDPMRLEVPTEVIYPLDRHFRKKARLEMAAQDHIDQNEETEDSSQGGYWVGDPMQVDQDEDDSMDDGDSRDFQWGYSVHTAWRFRDTHMDTGTKALTRFKLLLHNDAQTETARNHLAPIIERLKAHKIIKSHLDVIADYLTCLLRHAKTELRMQGLYDGYNVEVVLCIPAIWKQQACRDMQTALASALQAADFKTVDVQNNSINNLFIVSEPEAAAAHVLKNYRDIRPQDTFVLLDAGGGTVDANTYTVNQTEPMRLKAEGAPPQGGLYGSSYLNEQFRDLIRDRLATEEAYFAARGDTIDAIAETIMMNEFEYRCKRSFDIYSEKKKDKAFACEGLEANRQKNFLRNRIMVKFEDIAKIFYKCLPGIEKLMLQQIEATREKGGVVNKVILIGGFAGSPSLRKYLELSLRKYCASTMTSIEFIVPSHDVSAVASGAVLRALNKDLGPERHAMSSYGIIRSEPYDQYKQHKMAKAKSHRDKCDGDYYVVNTIYWLLKLGSVIRPLWRSKSLLCSHNIPCHPPGRLICEELLYVSDSATESHYSKRHSKNKGSQRVGRIIVDFTYLRDKGLITPIEPTVSENGQKAGRRHYKIQYKIVLQVVDRDLKCFAIYDGRIVTQGRINISSAFPAGTK